MRPKHRGLDCVVARLVKETRPSRDQDVEYQESGHQEKKKSA
jgi:hypothetical protein